MAQKYIVKSTVYTMSGDAPAYLAEYGGQIKFSQHFERAWSTLLFDTELDALNKLRELYPDKQLTVFEDTGRVVTTWGHESGLTSMKIQRVSW